MAVKINQNRVAEIELQKKQKLATERLLEIDLLSLRPLRAMEGLRALVAFHIYAYNGSLINRRIL